MRAILLILILAIVALIALDVAAPGAAEPR